MKLFATENYAVAVQPHGTKFKLILAAMLWNLDQWERGRRFHTLLPISLDCPDPVIVNKQVFPALRDFHCVEISNFFVCLFAQN